MKTDNNDLESTITLDLHEYGKNELINLIMYAHKNDFTFNQAIVDILGLFLESPQEYLESPQDSE